MNSNTKLKTIIVGSEGKQGRMYCSLLNSLNNITVVGLVDKKYENNSDNFHFNSTDECANNLNIDLAIVAIDHNMHYPVCKKLLLKGINVIKEKPFAVKINEAQELMQIAIDKNIGFFVVSQKNILFYTKR